MHAKLNYIGKGYTPKFVANYDAVIARLNQQPWITVVGEPDDICAPRLRDPDDADVHCHEPRIKARDDLALTDMQRLGQANALPELAALDYDGHIQLTAGLVTALRRASTSSTIRQACSGCQWYDLCTDVAKAGYKASRLNPPR